MWIYFASVAFFTGGWEELDVWGFLSIGLGEDMCSYKVWRDLKKVFHYLRECWNFSVFIHYKVDLTDEDEFLLSIRRDGRWVASIVCRCGLGREYILSVYISLIEVERLRMDISGRFPSRGFVVKNHGMYD